MDGYDFAILQTRDSMKDAVGLYARLIGRGNMFSKTTKNIRKIGK